jgi:hypothetical protein
MPAFLNQAVEMPARGKNGKPTSGFPSFPPSLQIPVGFAHFHRLGYDEPYSFFKEPCGLPDRDSETRASPVRKGLVNHVPGTKCKECSGTLTP